MKNRSDFFHQPQRTVRVTRDLLLKICDVDQKIRLARDHPVDTKTPTTRRRNRKAPVAQGRDVADLRGCSHFVWNHARIAGFLALAYERDAERFSALQAF